MPELRFAKENRQAIFRTLRLLALFRRKAIKRTPVPMYARSFFGVSAGARTRTGSVGGSNGIQFHHGHKFSAFYKLFLQTLFTNSFYNSFCCPKPFFIFLYLFYSFLLSFCKRLWYNIFKFLKIFFFRPFFGAFCPFFRRFSPRFPFFQRGATSKILFREYLLCKKR